MCRQPSQHNAKTVWQLNVETDALSMCFASVAAKRTLRFPSILPVLGFLLRRHLGVWLLGVRLLGLGWSALLKTQKRAPQHMLLVRAELLLLPTPFNPKGIRKNRTALSRRPSERKDLRTKNASIAGKPSRDLAMRQANQLVGSFDSSRAEPWSVNQHTQNNAKAALKTQFACNPCKHALSAGCYTYVCMRKGKREAQI